VGVRCVALLYPRFEEYFGNVFFDGLFLRNADYSSSNQIAVFKAGKNKSALGSYHMMDTGSILFTESGFDFMSAY
jgi:hypothetical protein